MRTIEPADPGLAPPALGPVPTHVYVTVVPAMADGFTYDEPPPPPDGLTVPKMLLFFPQPPPPP